MTRNIASLDARPRAGARAHAREHESLGAAARFAVLVVAAVVAGLLLLALPTGASAATIGDAQSAPLKLTGSTLKPTSFNLGVATTEASDPKPSCATGATTGGTTWISIVVAKTPAATTPNAGRLLRIRAAASAASLVAIYAVAPNVGTEVVCRTLPAPAAGAANGSVIGLDQTILGGYTYYIELAAQAAGAPDTAQIAITLAASNAAAGTPLPARRQAPMVAAVGSTIYAIGGVQTSYLATAQAPFHTAEIDALSPRTGKWAAVAKLPVGLSYGRAITLGGKVYLPGGRSNTDHGAGCIVGTTFAYDPKSKQVAALAAQPTPTLYDYAAAADPASGLVLVAGGLWDPTPCDTGGADDQQVAAFLRAYDPKTNAWTQLAPMATPRAGAAAVVVDGTLFVLGGLQGTTARAEVEAYTVRTKKWTSLPKLPLAVYEPAYGVGEGATGHQEIVVSGGWTSGGVLPAGVAGAGQAVPQGEVGIVQVYDTYTGKWSLRAGALGMPRNATGSVVAMGRLWSVGGYSAGQVVRSVEQLVIDRHPPTVVVHTTVKSRRVRLTAYVQDASGAGTIAWTFPRGAIASRKLRVGKGPNVVRTFAKAGTFTVKVVAHDAVGNARRKLVRVVVK